MQEISLDKVISTLDKFKGYLSDEQVDKLIAIVKLTRSDAALALMDDSDAGLSGSGEESVTDLMVEIQALVAYVRKLRKDLTKAGNNTTPRELKDLILASSSLFSMLTKLNENITNQGRLRKVENATVEAIKTLDKSAQAVFFTKLEEFLHE